MNRENAVERMSKGDIAALFRKQKELAPRLAASTCRDRRKKLASMLDYLTRHATEIEQAAYSDMKKPAAEVKLSEIITLTSEIKYHLKHLNRWMGPHRVPTPLLAIGTRSYVRFEAKGTSLIISPWNYPVSLAIKPLIAAVSAGCTAIIKPSEFTPGASAFIRNFVRNIFTPEEVAVVEGDKEVAAELLELPFDHIFFTGSPAVGKVVMRAAAEHLTSVSLELGGKSPSVIDETADIRATAQQIAWAKFLNNGQTCIAPDYVLVHEKVHAAFLSEIKSAIGKMYTPAGNPIQQSPDYARIIGSSHFDRLYLLYQDALAKGAELVFGGSFDEQDLFIEPTVLDNATPEMSVMQEEIFGPILPVIPFGSVEEAVKKINELEKPLALYIHSRSSSNTDYILAHTSSGNALVNEMLLQFQHPEIPFGGTGNSGAGKANGFFGFQEFSNAKGIIKRKFGTVKFLYPPYSPFKARILEWMQKYI